MKIIIVNLLIGSVYSLLPFLFELPINDQPDCVDNSSDCLEKIGLCKNKAFEEIMRTRCPKTCRVCGEIVKDLDDYEPIVVDKPVQRHKTLSPSMIEKWSKFLALNVDNDFDETNYGPMMMNVDANTDLDNEDYATNSDELFISESTEHQASTIMPPSAILQPPPSYPLPPMEKFPEHHNNIPSTYHRRRPCQDHAPNCFYLRKLCQNSFYQPIMKKNCEKTCQFCVQKKHVRTKWTNIDKRPSHSWITSTIQNEHCRNKGLDCDEKMQLCTHWRYWKFMRRVCPASCGFCDVNL